MARAKGTTKAVAGAAGATRRSAGQHVAKSPWRPTALQRDYRALLDAAKSEPQDILDSDGELLVIQLKDRADFETELAERVRELARFQAVYSANRDKPVAEWAAQTAFPYLAAFSAKEVAGFAAKLHTYTLAAAQHGTLRELQGNLEAWKATAEVYGQPEILAAIKASIDYANLEEVFPPSDAEVEASQE